jgi:hypothetical protein
MSSHPLNLSSPNGSAVVTRSYKERRDRIVTNTDRMQDKELSNDTSPEAEMVLINLLRRAPAWRKFKMVGDLNATVKQFALQGIRQRYPDADEIAVRRRLADILLGEELAAKVYGPYPQ